MKAPAPERSNWTRVAAVSATFKARWRTVAWIACLIVVGAEVSLVLLSPHDTDAHAYWSAQLDDPYLISRVGASGAYIYSPAFLQILTPLRLLPFSAFWAAWVVGGALIVVWLVGAPVAALVLLPTPLSPAFTELWFGNIVFPMAAALALGRRFPALWSLLLLTKVTPGVGLAWFVVRREWNRLAWALGVTVAIATASFLINPRVWAEWFAILAANFSAGTPDARLALPALPVRLLVALMLIAVGAYRNWPAVLPMAVVIALPVFWYQSLSLLLVWIYDLRRDRKIAGQTALRPAGVPAVERP